MTFEGERGRISDTEPAAAGVHRLEARVESGRCRGFAIGDVRRELSPAEIELMGMRGQGPGVTAWMDGLKRVGFLALLRNIAAGDGAYPLDDAIEDSVVDYFLERLGRYRATPFTYPNAGPARLAFSLLTRLAP
jgi:hypothetical protein